VAEDNEQNNVASSVVHLVPAPECDDALEPNDTFEEASLVGHGVVSGLLVCGADQDFFEVCPSGDTLTMSVTFDPTADIDIALFDANRVRIDDSQGLGGTETVSATVTPGVCYTLQVFLFGRPAAVSAEYTLSVEAASSACTQIFEPNNSFVEATPMADAAGMVVDFCPRGDPDFFQMELSANVGVLVEVTPLAGAPAGDLSLTVYGPATEFVNQRFARDIALELTPEQTGTHYFRRPLPVPDQRAAKPVSGRLLILRLSLEVAVAAWALWPAVVSSAPGDPGDLRERYVKASVALGCNGLEFAGLEQGAQREAANDVTLRNNGFDRASYGDAAFAFGSLPEVVNAVDKGLGACQIAEDPSVVSPGSFTGTFKGVGIDGTLTLRVTGTAANGSINGSAGARRFSFRFRGQMNGSRLRLTDRTPGRDPFSYLLSGVVAGGRFDGSLRVTFEAQTSYLAKFSVP
jgi:hypothetical protein